MYTPIIRNRQSEVLALKHLDSEVKLACTPLLDIAAPAKKEDTTETRKYVERNISRFEKALPGFYRALVDSSELDTAFRMDGNRHPLQKAAEAIKNAGCVPIPVTGIHRDESHMNSAFQVRETLGDGSICLRLDETDVGTASLSCKQILSLLSEHSVNTNDVILLMDLQSVYRENVDSLVIRASRFIIQISKYQWAGIIFAGYGVPDQISEAIGVRGQGYIPRVEQSAFSEIKRNHHIGNLWFGDYTTLAPTQVELDWWIVQKVMTPRIIYALDDSWFVIRGGPFSRHGYGQYHDLAADVEALDEFSGPEYSYGDKYIHNCANRISSTGNAPSWITACVNHHITLSANAHRGRWS